MIKRFGIVLLLAVTLTFNGYSQLGRGGLLEKRDTSLILKRNFPRNTFNFPASYSLKKWAPPVLSQGNLSSCTAWSSAYAGFTIIRRMEENDPSLEPFSAINLYNRLKAEDSQDPCYAGGCYVSDACEMLEDHGCAKFKEVDNSCGYTSASKNYKDKLYNHDELNVSEHDIKSALVKNSPVVIVIPFYNDGWDKKENLKNGVWNGQASGEDGYHAMCIIGYDDNVGGGAFHVMNSWGDDWAQNGFFWLRYKDIEHINQAVMLVGDPNKLKDFKNNNTDNTDYTTDNTNNNNTDNNNTDNTDNSNNNDQYDHWDEGHNQVFRLYNECTVPAYLAIAMFVDGEWVSRGWYATQPDDYVEIPIGNRGADNIFWMAVN